MTKVHTRWIVADDMRSVLEIENRSFEFPWSRESFYGAISCRNVIGIVAEDMDSPNMRVTSNGLLVRDVIGYMIYELRKTSLDVFNFAVRDTYRRRGVGTAMVDKLVRKLSPVRRRFIDVEVRESNVSAQLFFRSCGFRWVSTLKDHYDQTDEDAYLMRRHLDQVDQTRKEKPRSIVSRISSLFTG